MIVEISGGEHIEFELSKQRLAKWNIRHSVLWDRNNQNAKNYAINGWPSAYLIGTDGKVFWQGNPSTLAKRKDELAAFRAELKSQLNRLNLVERKDDSPSMPASLTIK